MGINLEVANWQITYLENSINETKDAMKNNEDAKKDESQTPESDISSYPIVSKTTNASDYAWFSDEIETIGFETDSLTVQFKYDLDTFGQPKMHYFKQTGGNYCGYNSAFFGDISFTKTDIKLFINPCGLGGVSQVHVGSFEADTKSGEHFIINYTNCVNVKEIYSYDSSLPAGQYEKDLQTIGSKCRNYALGTSHTGSDKVRFQFMFQTTADKEALVNSQIKSIIESMVIKSK